MKPILLIVGSNPSPRDPEGMLTEKSASGRRLREWLKILNRDNVFEVVVTNVSDVLGVDYISKRHMNLNRLKELHKQAAATISLGVVSNRALNLFTADFITMYHPSPQNRKLNDIGDVNAKLKGIAAFLREKLNEAHG